MRNIAVIAGTPVDTQMGADYLVSKNISSGKDCGIFPYNAFENPRVCSNFQMRSAVEKESFFTDLFMTAIKEHAARDFFIYCNSLSAAVDFESIGKKLGVNVITPLMVYRRLAQSCTRVAVIAANNQSTAGIEKAFTDANPKCYVTGLGMLALVEAVESKLPPAEIVEKYRLSALSDFFKSNRAEALVLGCTHFPYFKDALAAVSVLPIIDPADMMFEMLLNCE